MEQQSGGCPDCAFGYSMPRVTCSPLAPGANVCPLVRPSREPHAPDY